MRNILISIKPEWVEKILNGEKTIEIRKTMPKCELPCKVYIYCTKEKPYLYRVDDDNNFELLKNKKYEEDIYVKDYNALNGKVVAEFTLNKIDDIKFSWSYSSNGYDDHRYNISLDKTCLDEDTLIKYLGEPWDICNTGSAGIMKYNGFAWHIDDLIIYDKLKELSDFKVWDKTYNNVGAFGWAFSDEQKYTSLKRPPQSYMFVEGE